MLPTGVVKQAFRYFVFCFQLHLTDILQCFLSVTPVPLSRPPQWVERLQGVRVGQGQSFALKAKATGVPLPTLAWQKVRSQTRFPSSNISNFYKDGHSIAPSPGLKMGMDGEGGAWLVVDGASPPLGGWYQLTAYNTAGSVTTQARVVVETPPEEAGGRGEPRLILPTPSRVIEPE